MGFQSIFSQKDPSFLNIFLKLKLVDIHAFSLFLQLQVPSLSSWTGHLCTNLNWLKLKYHYNYFFHCKIVPSSLNFGYAGFSQNQKCCCFFQNVLFELWSGLLLWKYPYVDISAFLCLYSLLLAYSPSLPQANINIAKNEQRAISELSSRTVKGELGQGKWGC